MTNLNPKTDHLVAHRIQPKSDRVLGRSINTRYPIEVQEVLDQLPDKQSFIRDAVEQVLLNKGYL